MRGDPVQQVLRDVLGRLERGWVVASETVLAHVRKATQGDNTVLMQLVAKSLLSEQLVRQLLTEMPRNVLHAPGPAMPQRHEGQRAADATQHAEGEHVDLEEPEDVQVILVPRDDRPILHSGWLDGSDLEQRPRRHDEAPDMDAEVPRKPNQLLGDFHDAFHSWCSVVQPRVPQPEPDIQVATVIPMRKSAG